MSGTVYLVGAGPGAPDLLTLRAARILADADIVFHDALVHPDTLALAPRAEKVLVGKRCGKHSTAQRFINKRLVDAACAHRVVVRLNGGDPMLFGRAHEEISALTAHGIPVEIVPGVTAALAAGAELGISLTQRGVAADTAVIYMGARDAAFIREALLALGVPSSKPVAVVENASLDGAACQAGTLDQLPHLAARCTGGPALVLIGEIFAAAQAAGTADLARWLPPRSASQSA